LPTIQSPLKALCLAPVRLLTPRRMFSFSCLGWQWSAFSLVVRFHHSPSLLPLHPDIFISFLLIRISRRLSISILYHLQSTLSTSHPHVPIPYILSRIFCLPLFLLPLSIVSLYHIHAQPLVSSEQFTSPFVSRNCSLQCFPFVLPCAALSTSHNPLYAWFVLPYIHYCSFYLPFFLLPLSIFHLPLFLLPL